MAKKAVFTIAIIGALLIIGQGCYTIIKHPNVELADHSFEYYSSNCGNCHDLITDYPYGYGYSSFPGYWEDYHNYGLYYTFPWWWESYWWDIDLEPNENYSPTGADRRRGIHIPQGNYVPPPAEVTNQSPTPGGSEGGGISTGGESGDGDSKQKDENSSQKDSEEKKTERRRLPSKEK
ncbi:MAG TPA: hypothetical protein ENO22_09805 [candidate division Zixibacteria bacterium]|nr:hypothetical protein [candidate division Zixibacteria bacterium]